MWCSFTSRFDPIRSIFGESQIVLPFLVSSTRVSKLDHMVAVQHVSNRRHRRLNKVSRVSTTSNVLGIPSSLPVFIAPAALARLGHPDGEMNLVRAAGRAGILQGVRHEVRTKEGDLSELQCRFLITRVARLLRSCRSSSQSNTWSSNCT